MSELWKPRIYTQEPKTKKGGTRRQKTTRRRRQKKIRRHRGGNEEEPTSVPAVNSPGEVPEVSENPTPPEGQKRKRGSKRV